MSMSMQELIDEGTKKGAYDNSVKTANRMLEAGKLSIKEISEYTGLSERKVKALSNKLKKAVELV